MSEGFLLVTGGAGYIGSHTVLELRERGWRVVVLDNLVFGHEEALDGEDEGVVFVRGDVGDAGCLRGIFERYAISAVLHFAAFAFVGESVEEPLKYYDNNVCRPVVLLGVMREFGCKRFILSSTCATYGNPVRVPMDESHPQVPVNPYGASKLMLERVIRDCEVGWGLQWVFLRYFNASGCDLKGRVGEEHDPEPHLIPRILMAVRGVIPALTVFGTDYDTPDGTCVRDYIHVEDLARAHALALGYLEGGGAPVAVNLGTGRGFSVKEIISVAEEVTGLPVPVSYGPRRAGDPPELVADAALAKAVLGWEAQHKDPRVHVSSAWKWMVGGSRGRGREGKKDGGAA